jgi:small subunit ribosomal protein S20
MANTKSAQKAANQNKKARGRNLSRRTNIKTAIKKVLVALEGGETAEQMQALLRDVASQLARAKGKHVIHANAASRKLSRLAKKVSTARKTV